VDQFVDRVRNRTFKELFEGPARYEIPFFQRGYAWGQVQWDQLYDDIVQEILPDVDGGMSFQETEHFFGPIVVLQSLDSGPVPKFLVIDGQQRITTVYLLLAIIKDRLHRLESVSVDASAHVAALSRLLTNPISADDDYSKLKLSSSKGDRLPTYRVLFGDEHAPVSPHYLTDVQLYSPGRNQVDAFYKYSLKKFKLQFKDVPSLWKLAGVILESLRIVWIPLDAQKDDPQSIFESLNDRGMPLTSSELLCSYIFRPLEKAPDFEQLHNQRWLSSLRKFDSNERFEEYLRVLFSTGEKKMIGKGRKTYVHFKNRNRTLSASLARHNLTEISENADSYRQIVSPLEYPHSEPTIAAQLVSISSTRMDSCAPFTLELLRAHRDGRIATPDVVSLLSQTTTMLVRWKTAERLSTIYDVLFPQLFTLVKNEPDKVKAIQTQFQKFGVYLSDQEFKDALVNRPLYRNRDLPFTRMVLAEIDKCLQDHGQYADYSTTNTIEHVIPQTLDDQWRAYLGDDVNHPEFSKRIHTIGNLCLLSQEANSSAGQNPFQRKVKGYSSVTALARQLQKNEDWSLGELVKRSETLAEVAVQRWSWVS